MLVVDNNSRDETKEVVDDFIRRYPGRFRYLFEEAQGKSYALNSGIRNARGEVLAFTDDDVVVDPAWLQNLTAGLCNGEWVGAGGRILPDWPCPPPSWFPANQRYGTAPLAMFDLGLEAGPLMETPFGANMAFHRSMFEKYGFFRTDLGPRPNSEIRNEDTEFSRRLLVSGESLKYEPAAIVYHSVPPKRLRKKYFLAWWFDKGRADVREAGVPADTKRFAWGVPLYLFRRIVIYSLRWAFAIGLAQRFAHRLAVWALAGRVVECFQQSKQPQKNEIRSGLPET